MVREIISRLRQPPTIMRQPRKIIPFAEEIHRPDEIDTGIREMQGELREYIAGLLGGAEGTEDLLQDTNLFLWERRSDYTPGTNFRAWAMRVAWFKVKAELRDRSRSGQVVFSEAILEQLA